MSELADEHDLGSCAVRRGSSSLPFPTKNYRLKIANDKNITLYLYPRPGKYMPSNQIRNFCIIAHIDHGKSTLADRLISATNTIESRNMKEQVLDSMDLERERGITIKSQAVRMIYSASDGNEYQLNLIDTPGHVDFTYEVSRSLAACEGAILIVDATQGIQAQTLANAYLAIENDLEIIPVINKIDLDAADPKSVSEEIQNGFGFLQEEILEVSAKDGTGIEKLLETIVEKVPAPTGNENNPLQALIFDSKYDAYKGVVSYVRIFDGTLKTNTKLQMMAAGTKSDVLELGIFVPDPHPTNSLSIGEVGYIATGLKNVGDAPVGDTITNATSGALEPLKGYQQMKPMVFAGLYPSNGEEYMNLRDALEKLRLNDAALVFQPENSLALGSGFRCGFLGLLHMEIVQQRLEQESNIDLIQTAPNVTYEILTQRGDTLQINRPQEVPDSGEIAEFRQPIVRVRVILPADYIGPVMKLCQERQGVQQDTEYLSPTRAILTYDLPLAEVIYDLHDKLKSVTRGYGTMDYDLTGYVAANLVRVDVLVNGNRVDALSIICQKSDAERRGRPIVKKLKSELDRHMFEVAVQAAIGARVVARETVPALRKNVTAKCYGGDISRKRKLWAKQREGKKRMKSIGQVDIPQKAFMAVLETGGDS